MNKIKTEVKGIPEDVKKQVEEMIRHFNQNHLKGAGCFYESRYQGKYLYLDRKEEGQGQACPICRLKFTGKIKGWDFAIYKYSSDRYDADEWFFPGQEFIDGTVEGAMKAGMEAYPFHPRTGFGDLLGDVKRMFKIF